MVYWMEACMNKNSYNRNLKTKKDLYSPLFIVDFFERPYSHSVTLLTSVGNKEQICSCLILVLISGMCGNSTVPYFAPARPLRLVH